MRQDGVNSGLLALNSCWRLHVALYRMILGLRWEALGLIAGTHAVTSSRRDVGIWLVPYDSVAFCC